MSAFLNSGHVSPRASTVMSPGIENNIPGMGIPFGPTLLPYYDPGPLPLMPFVQPNPFLLPPLTLQQSQNALAASFLNKTQQKSYSIPPPGYQQWAAEMEQYKPSTTSVTTTTDSLVKPKTTEAEILPTQAELFAQYPAQPSLYFLHPNLSRVLPSPMYSKPGFPAVSHPLLFPQLTPQLPHMGMLGVKRSWEQAFPLETAAVQGAKRWPTSQAASFTTPGFFHDVG